MNPEKRPISSILLKVSFPIWFRALYAVGGPFVLFLVLTTVLSLTRDQLSTIGILKVALLIALLALGAWVLPVFFSTIYVTRSGIQRTSIFGRTKNLSWDEIKTVARPRFGIPGDAAYIISKMDDKIIIGRSMTGYPELVRMIQAHAPEVKDHGLPEDLLQSKSGKSWRGILIFFGLFIAYVLIRKLTGW
jgi:hypothetical protein